MLRIVVVALLCAACGQEPIQSPVDAVHDPLGHWTETGAPGTAPTDPEDSDPLMIGPADEVCDGRDNDDDGLVDEELAAGSCVTDSGAEGVLACLFGEMRCAVCQPGERRRTNACACGLDRVDTCDGRGEWAEGPCDGCELAPPIPCGFCGHLDGGGNCVGVGVCEPGDQKIRRCDACPTDEGCGAHTCVGQAMVCNDQCQWEARGNCELHQPQCTRDLSRTEPCGQCGSVELACDGCFWKYDSVCQEEGECVRGSERSVACDGGCGYGGYRVSTQRCNAECRWETIEGCRGCEPGGPYFRTHSCACSAFRTTEQFYCERRPVDDACGLGIGVEVDHTMLDECPPVTCHPGQSEESGGECRTCKNDCEWGDWVECGSSEPPPPPGGGGCGCTDGQTRVVSCNDLCGNTTTEMCADCAWERTPCPHCDH